MIKLANSIKNFPDANSKDEFIYARRRASLRHRLDESIEILRNA